MPNLAKITIVTLARFGIGSLMMVQVDRNM
jgi:hypothetical protein